MRLKPLLTSLLSFTILSASAQTTLAPGDIAFTGVNCTNNTINDFVNTPQSESNREFRFVLLKAVTDGTEILFTDFGWRTDQQAFQTALPCGPNTGALTDGAVRWRANGDLPYGTQIVIRCLTNPKANVGTASALQATNNSATQYVTLNSNGEAIFAFTGSLATPTLIAGINASPGGWVSSLSNCDLAPNVSSLPNVLNNALNGNRNYAFAVLPVNTGQLGFCMRLKPNITIGTDPLAARTTIYTSANWESNNTPTPYQLIGASSVLPVSFGTINASITGSNLSVYWETTSETNCKKYIIEASTDGSSWTTIGTAPSKAPGGNSDSGLSYSFNLDLEGLSLGFLGLPALLLFIPRKRKYLLAAALILGTVLIACNKKTEGTNLSTVSKIFIRIVQQDIDGSTSHSKAVQAVVK